LGKIFNAFKSPLFGARRQGEECELTLSRFFDTLEPHLIEGVSSDRQMPEMSF